MPKSDWGVYPPATSDANGKDKHRFVWMDDVNTTEEDHHPHVRNRAGGVIGCQTAAKEGLCLQCTEVPGTFAWLPNRNWRLTHDGKCYLPADRYMTRTAQWLVILAGVALLLGVIGQCAIVHMNKKKAREGARKKKKGRHEEDDEDDTEALKNPLFDGPVLHDGIPLDKFTKGDPVDDTDSFERSKESISHGLQSWLQRQMRDWEMKGKDEPPRYNPCKINVSKDYIMGPGLPLFFSFKVKVFASALLTAVMLIYVQRSSGLTDMLDKILHEKATDIFPGSHPLRDYARNMFRSLGMLYVMLFILSVAHFRYQVKFVKRFDSMNSSMRDFALHFRGLPRDCVDEGRLKTIVEKQFDCSGEVLGVSICYDLSNPKTNSKVFEMFENRIVRADVAHHHDDGTLARAGWGYPEKLARMSQLDVKQDRDEFNRMWTAEDLRCSGHAFVVFKSKAHLHAVDSKYRGMWIQSQIQPSADEVAELKKILSSSFFGHYRDSSLEGYSAEHMEQRRQFKCLSVDMVVGGTTLLAGTRLYDADRLEAGRNATIELVAEIVDDTLEPTSTLWFNFGTLESQMRRNGWKYVVNVGVAWLAITMLVYGPLFYFLVTPCGYARTSPQPWSSQLSGILLAIAGNVLGVVNWNCCCAIGFISKPDQDQNFVLFSTFVSYFNSILFVGAGLYYYIVVGFNQVNMTDVRLNTWEVFRNETHLYDAFSSMMIPGWLFAGVITGKFMGWFMPVIQNFVLTKLTFTTGCLPRPLRKLFTMIIPWNPEPDWLTARQAEHIFEPPEMALAWEYNMYIVTPCVCYSALFVMSPHSWRVFACLTLWAAFMYFLQRVPTMVISKKHNTGHMVDLLAEKLWGIPLAMVLAAFGFWGVRCDHLGNHNQLGSYVIVGVLFALGLILHQFALEVMGASNFKTMDLVDQTYDETERRLRYTWFNCNPVHVLKSCYCPKELGQGVEKSRAVVPFEFGKEYLQIFGERMGVTLVDGEEIPEETGDNFFGNLFGCQGGSSPKES